MSLGDSAVPAQVGAYEVSVPDDAVDSVPAGSSILVEGAAMSDKESLALELLSGDSPAIVVTPDTAAKRLRRAYESVGGDPDRLWIVDCSGSSGQSRLQSDDHVEYVSAPDDLTGVGIGIAKATRRIGSDADDGLRMGLLSLSTMLQYTGQERLFNFLHVVTGRISAGDYLGVGTFDPTSHSAETVNVVRSQFDGLLELRDTESGQEAKLRGLGGSRTWTPR